PAGIPCGVLSLWRRDYCIEIPISEMRYQGCSNGNAGSEFIKTHSWLAPRGGFVFGWIGCSAV
ncbi:hypothetical protein, partial [Achromobacter mucicolens]|uniref:hypothetical protein n=1 Tax=Achromobacter mucicolens TaxID=1389922 RepID=UPI00289E2A17